MNHVELRDIHSYQAAHEIDTTSFQDEAVATDANIPRDTELSVVTGQARLHPKAVSTNSGGQLTEIDDSNITTFERKSVLTNTSTRLYCCPYLPTLLMYIVIS